jgi:PPE family protein
MCFARIPPEINSGRMFAGAGATSMVRAAAAWDELSSKLSATSESYRAATLELNKGWRGAVAVAVMHTMARYLGWLDIAADQAARAATKARAAAKAHESVMAVLVSPEAIVVNRAQLVVLAVTNCLGQSSPAIAETEAEYERMWAIDAYAMYDYARASADASALAPLNSPSGIDGPEVSITRPAASSPSWWAEAPSLVSATQDVMAAIPKALQAISASPRTTLDEHLLPATSALSMLSSLSPPSAVAIRNLNSMNKTTMLLKMAASITAPGERADDAPLAAGFGSGVSVGSLTVPQRWVTETTPSEVMEIPSGWTWEPMRLVHSAAHSGDDT